MALTRFGFIVTGSGLDPDLHHSEMSSPTFTMTVIGVSSPDQGVQAAQRLVQDGVQLIELCGGFGPQGAALVIDAVGPDIPVGSVGYGPESIASLTELFR